MIQLFTLHTAVPKVYFLEVGGGLMLLLPSLSSQVLLEAKQRTAAQNRATFTCHSLRNYCAIAAAVKVNAFCSGLGWAGLWTLNIAFVLWIVVNYIFGLYIINKHMEPNENS